jgi:hypothetical protein
MWQTSRMIHEWVWECESEWGLSEKIPSPFIPAACVQIAPKAWSAALTLPPLNPGFWLPTPSS